MKQRDTQTPRHGAARLLLSLAAVAVAALLWGCQTAAPPPPPVLPLSLRIEAVHVRALSLNSVRISIVASVTNPNRETARIAKVDSRLTVGGAPMGVHSDEQSRSIDGDGGTTIPIEYTIRMADLFSERPGLRSRSSADWHIAVSVRSAVGGTSHTSTATKSGTFPIVQQPTVRITALRIERYDLIESKLRLELAVHNPNAFPVNLSTVDYQFYAQKRIWGNGEVSLPASIPAQSTVEVHIPLLLNFIEMGRRVLDIVASLGTVDFRLVGSAQVATALSFIPRFTMKFDRTGSIRVQK